MPKNVLVTGSTQGIGLAIAMKFIEEGYNVFITGRNEQKLKELSEKYSVSYCAVDLLIEGNYKRLYETAKAKIGAIDILVNNAGDYVYASIEKTTSEDVERLISLNFKAPYMLTQLAISDMKKNLWGRVINIGSISGAVGEANATLYSATKSSLIGLTKALALEVAEYNVTANIINPGWVKTDLADKTMGIDGNFDEVENLEMIPQHRFIVPEEIADMALYLASEKAKGITGQYINLCAGLSLG